MSAFDSSSFYSFDSTGNEGSPGSEMERDAQIFGDSPDQPQGPVTPPPYDMNEGASGAFDDRSSVSDPSFQAGVAPVSGFQIQPWMILAAGAALVLLMRNDKRGYE